LNKQKTIMTGFLAVFLLNGIAGTSLYAFKNGDIQYWPRVGMQGKLNNRFAVNLEQEFRIGGQIGDFYFSQTDFGIRMKLTSWLDCSVHFRSVFSESSDKWIMEERPHFNFIFTWKTGKIKWGHRSRFEYRKIADRDPFWRYRSQISVFLPMKNKCIHIEPYITDEINIDEVNREINRNRMYAGIKIKGQENMSYALYYLYEKNKRDNDWTGIHVIGSKVIFTF